MATLWLLLLFPATVRAQGLTEGEAVARALRRAPLTDVLAGDVAIEEGRARTAGALPNPSLNYAREQTFGSAGTGEDYLTLSQSIDLGGRRSLRGQAGDVRAEAARREGDATRLGVAVEARERFYDQLSQQLRVAALEAWTKRVAAAVDVIRKREQKGDVARYDRRRIERESMVASARLASERATLERSRARLQAVLGEAGPLTATGTLLPDTDPPPLEQLRALGRSRPDFLALDLRVEASALDRRAAGRWWVPDLRLEGGWKGVDLPGNARSDGFLLGLSLTPPLWDHSWGAKRTAEGEARAAHGRRLLLASELAGELSGARTEALQRRHAAAEFRGQMRAASDDVVRMALLGYEGGELGVLELLDAYRGAIDDELTSLDMEHAARRSRIDLDRLSGAALPSSF